LIEQDFEAMPLFLRAKHTNEIALGDQARDTGQWLEAARHYRSALSHKPDNPGIWVQFGHALKESGYLAPAERAYRRSLEQAPLLADTHLQLGHVLKLQQRVDEAREAYLRAVALDPSNEQARSELSAFEWCEEELTDARQAVTSIAAPPKSEVRDLSPNARADRARDIGQWEEASYFYRKALARNPHKAELWVQYGNMLKEQGKLGAAEAALRTALGYLPGLADAHLQLGHVLKLSGDRDAAVAAYLRGFVLTPQKDDGLAELRGLGWNESELAALRLQVEDEATATNNVAAPQLTTPIAIEAQTPSQSELAFREPTPARLNLPDPSTMPNRQRLRDYLIDEQFGDHAANRTLDYFRVVEAVRLASERSPQPRSVVMQALLERLTPLALAAADNRPIEASIIVPVYNHIEYTVGCILSILEHRCDTRFEIIVADDASTDETSRLFSEIGGVVRCLTTGQNAGFLRNCNWAASHASGKYIVFLNNDTFVLDDWLDELLAPFDRFKNVGLVGAKLLMADGTLQEAGGIIWCDGSGWNFGRGQDPRICQFNYVKDTDYASGAAIALSQALWQQLGGFDERFVPAYCEDTDLAFAIRARGLRTLYAPHSQVIHHEGVSHGTDITAGIKAYQVVNGEKFVAK